MLAADVPLQIVQPGSTLAPPPRVLAVRMRTEPQRSRSHLWVHLSAVLLEVVFVLPPTSCPGAARDWALVWPCMFFEVLTSITTSVRYHSMVFSVLSGVLQQTLRDKVIRAMWALVCAACRRCVRGRIGDCRFDSIGSDKIVSSVVL